MTYISVIMSDFKLKYTLQLITVIHKSLTIIIDLQTTKHKY